MDDWRRRLLELHDTPEKAQQWREYRTRNALRVGEALVGPVSGTSITGPAIYGVYLKWGALYVGQTLEAQRRLRDLPIGESHHLANTYPAEIWDRVVVVAWPELPDAGRLIDSLGAKTVGLSLEHRLQLWTSPLISSARRTSGGGWRAVDLTSSRSAGAVAAGKIDSLFGQVSARWGEALDAGLDGHPRPDVVRCVKLADLI